MSQPIRFSYHLPFRIREAGKVKRWFIKTARSEGFNISQLVYNFVSDRELLKINQQHLNHDTYTDIITFDYSSGRTILSEIYISVDRVKENAKSNKTSQKQEFLRVLIHGLLHCCGYKDKTKAEQKAMRAKENECLSFYFSP